MVVPLPGDFPSDRFVTSGIGKVSFNETAVGHYMWELLTSHNGRAILYVEQIPDMQSNLADLTTQFGMAVSGPSTPWMSQLICKEVFEKFGRDAMIIENFRGPGKSEVSYRLTSVEADRYHTREVTYEASMNVVMGAQLEVK